MWENLDSLKQDVISCTDCELCKTRTNAVTGKGDHHTEIMFVGEAPGRNEDLRGEPFIGAAGKKLDSALAEAGLSRDSIYITNVVKCRPPNNRVPTKQEKESCKKFLDSEIALIKPKIICIMGNTAYNSILGGSEITKNRGKIINQGGRRYFITIHPAATIYNPELISTLQKDIKTIVEFVKSPN